MSFKYFCFITLVFLSSALRAQNNCSEVFGPFLPVKLKSAGVFGDSNSQGEVRRTQMLKLLKMMSESSYQSVSEKESAEKGEMILGVRIQEGVSLELTYEGDKRSDEVMFKLMKLELVMPNLSRKTILKGPTDEQMKNFKELEINREIHKALKVALSAEELQRISQAKEFKSAVEVPLVIQGPLASQFIQLADATSLMDGKKLRKHLMLNHLERIHWTVQILKARDFLQSRVLRQATNALLMVGALFSFTYFNNQFLNPTVETSQKNSVEVVSVASSTSDANVWLAAEARKNGKPQIYFLPSETQSQMISVLAKSQIMIIQKFDNSGKAVGAAELAPLNSPQAQTLLQKIQVKSVE